MHAGNLYLARARSAWGLGPAGAGREGSSPGLGRAQGRLALARYRFLACRYSYTTSYYPVLSYIMLYYLILCLIIHMLLYYLILSNTIYYQVLAQVGRIGAPNP